METINHEGKTLTQMREAAVDRWTLTFLPYLPDGDVLPKLGYAESPKTGYGYGSWTELFASRKACLARYAYLARCGAIEWIKAHEGSQLIADWDDSRPIGS